MFCFVVFDGIVDYHCVVRIADIDGILDNHSLDVMFVLMILVEMLIITV